MTQSTHEASNDHQLPPVELSSSEQLIVVAVAVLEQAVELVEESLQTDEQLSFPSVLIPGSTIGQYSLIQSYHSLAIQLLVRFSETEYERARQTSPTRQRPLFPSFGRLGRDRST